MCTRNDRQMCSTAIFAVADSFLFALNWSAVLDDLLGSSLHLFDVLLELNLSTELCGKLLRRFVELFDEVIHRLLSFSDSFLCRSELFHLKLCILTDGCLFSSTCGIVTEDPLSFGFEPLLGLLRFSDYLVDCTFPLHRFRLG